MICSVLLLTKLHDNEQYTKGSTLWVTVYLEFYRIDNYEFNNLNYYVFILRVKVVTTSKRTANVLFRMNWSKYRYKLVAPGFGCIKKY